MSIRYLKKISTVFIFSILFIYVIDFFITRDQNLSDRLSLGSSIHIRFLIWQQAFQAFKAHPFLGWGQEGFTYATKYYLPKLWVEPLHDRTHNIILELLTTAGLIGLISYLVIFKRLLEVLFNKINSNFHQHQKAFLFGGLVFYCVNNQFVFDNITSYFLLFSAIGFTYFIESHEQPIAIVSNNLNSLPRNNILKMLFLGSWVSMISAWIYFSNIQNIQINMNLLKTVRSAPLFYYDQNGQFKLILEDILEKNSFGHSEAVEQMMLLAERAATEQPDGVYKNYIYNLADLEIKKEIASDPQRTYFIHSSGDFYLSFGKLDEAEKMYIMASEQSPMNQHILISIGKVNIAQKKYRRALEFFKKAFELDPSFKEAQENYENALKLNNL